MNFWARLILGALLGIAIGTLGIYGLIQLAEFAQRILEQH